jgi:hypothetical protein
MSDISRYKNIKAISREETDELARRNPSSSLSPSIITIITKHGYDRFAKAIYPYIHPSIAQSSRVNGSMDQYQYQWINRPAMGAPLTSMIHLDKLLITSAFLRILT